ncbi:MAG: substrate-binding domain-containing protein [Solirubrobacterales bacterium]|nr:substrate-binding domain-containing protein [Solirubrobacterales bacterium]
MPDTTSSTRYVEFDQPMIKKAAMDAGVPASDIIVQNGENSDQTFLSDAQADITNGASVLLIDPEDSGTGLHVEQYAKQHGVQVIDYDRLVTGKNAPVDPYVSFDNTHIGQLIGQGFNTCVKSWGVKNPNVIVMRGDPTDNNSALFYKGYYTDELAPKIKSGAYKLAANTAGTWTPNVAQTEFEQAYTAHKSANSALVPNDENAAPIITYLKSHGVKPHQFPVSGQDATLTGLQNVLGGYQCGTVYKPVYSEAEAAVALAVYLRAGKTAPPSLLNGTSINPANGAKVPSVLLPSHWITSKDIEKTVIKDKFVPAKQLCAGQYATECKKNGIS